MTKIVSELIVSIDMCARGTKSPGYYGFLGLEFGAWLKANNEAPHRMLIGRKTYEMMNGLPDAARDEGWHKTTRQPGFLFSRSLKRCDWPGLALVHDDMPEFVRRLRDEGGPELRVLGSLSIMRQLVQAEMLDLLRLMICPLAVPESGVEPVFEGLPDTAFALAAQRTLDDRILILDYRPNGVPPGIDSKRPAA